MSRTLSPLGRAGVRLETSAAGLAGILGRDDLAEVDQANADHLLQRDLFRAELEHVTGMPSGQIERLLNL